MRIDIDKKKLRGLLEDLGRYLDSVQDEGIGGTISYTQAVDMPKLYIADGLLRALNLPRRPAPQFDNYTATDAPLEERRRYIPSAVRWAVYRRDNYQCVTCGSDQHLSLDHIVPISRGGTDEESNLQTMCRPCNSTKGARQ